MNPQVTYECRDPQFLSEDPLNLGSRDFVPAFKDPSTDHLHVFCVLCGAPARLVPTTRVVQRAELSDLISLHKTTGAGTCSEVLDVREQNSGHTKLQGCGTSMKK